MNRKLKCTSVGNFDPIQFEKAAIMLPSVEIICIIIFQCVQLIYSEESNNNVNGDELVFAQTLCRHGDRNPYNTFPNDPIQVWPEGFAALTDVGRQEHFTLGQYLRHRYSKLLKEGSSLSNSVRVQSTDTERTVSSAEANLAGFLSFPSYRMFKGFLDWQPIPVQTFLAKEDYLLATMKQCDHFDYVMVEYLEKDNNYEAFWRHFRPLVKYLEENSGMKIENIEDLVFLNDRLKYNKIPEWANKLMNPGNDLEKFFLFWLQMHTTTTEMKKLKGGYLLKEIFDRFQNKTQSILPSELSLWMYFAHDLTMINILRTLNMFEVHFPPYASCLFFELYESKEGHYVQILYRNSTESDVPSLEIPNCGKKCPLHKLYDLYKDVLPARSFDVECTLREGEILPLGGNPENYVV